MKNKLFAVALCILIIVSAVACVKGKDEFDGFGTYYSVYADDSLNKSESIVLFNDFTWRSSNIGNGTFKVSGKNLTFESDGTTVFKGTFSGKDLIITSEGSSIVYRKESKDNTGNTTIDTEDPIKNDNVYITVNFETIGGNVIEPISVRKGELLLNPPVPVKEKYTFEGWYLDKNYTKKWNFEENVLTESIVLYANWVGTSGTIMSIDASQVKKLVFENNFIEITVGKNISSLDFKKLLTVGINTEWQLRKEIDGAPIKDKIADKLQNGDNSFFILTFTENEDNDIIYEVNIHRAFTVAIEIFDEDELVATINTETNQTIKCLEPDYLVGFTIDGYIDEDEEIFLPEETIVKENKKLFIQKTPFRFGITLNANGGELTSNKKIIDYGSEFSLPVPFLAGYSFEGWEYSSRLLTDGNGDGLEKWSFTEDITAIAIWKVAAYRVSLKRNNDYAGITHGTGNYYYNDTVTISAETRIGYMWIGWFDGETKVSEGGSSEYEFVMPYEEVVLTAVWEESTYTFEKSLADAGELIGIETIAFDTQTTVSAIPNDGYTWLGWFDGNASEPITKDYEFVFIPDDIEEKHRIIAKWIVCPVNLVNENPEAGNISGAEKTVINDITSINAIPNDGYTFYGWFDGENKISADGKFEYSFLMTEEERTITAKWIACPVTVSKNIDNARTIVTDGADVIGGTTTVTAYTENGYTFIGWFNNGEIVSESLDFAFKLTETEIEYTAKWYKLDVEKNIELGGSIVGLNDKAYNIYDRLNDTATLNAVTNDGYVWVGWYKIENNVDTFISSDYSINVKMTGEDIIYKAAWIKLTVNKNKEDCDITELNDTYVCNESITLNGNSAIGYTFVGWYFDGVFISDDLTCSLTLPERGENIPEDNAEYLFSAEWSKLTVNTEVVDKDEESGTVTKLTDKYKVGDEVTLTAVSDYGYIWLGWYNGTEKLETSAEDPMTITYEMTNTDTTLTAKWYRLGVEVSSDRAGSVVYQASEYKIGEKFTVSSHSNKGYVWLGWFIGDECVSREHFYEFDIPSQPADIVATWYKLEIQKFVEGVSNGNGGSISAFEREYEIGDEIQVAATVNDGYTFVGWYINDELVDGRVQLRCDYTLPDEEITIKAKWIKCPFNVAKSIEAAGTITGMEKSVLGDSVTVVAETKENTSYYWLGWYDDDGKQVSPNYDFTFVLTEDKFGKTFTANWLNINVRKSINEAGTVKYPTSYEVGRDMELEAETLNKNFLWVGWFDGPTKISEGTDKIVQIPIQAADKIYEARWVRNTITVTQNDPDAGIVSGENTITDVGGKATLIAKTNNGYTWFGWYVSGALDTENSTIESITDENGELVTIAKYEFIVESGAPVEIKAKWVPCTVKLEVNDSAAGSVGGVEKDTYIGMDTELVAETKDSYTFVGWYEYNEETEEYEYRSGDLKYVIVMPEENKIYRAFWYKLNIINDDEAGTVSGLDSKYTVGSIVTLTATENTGFTLLGWYINGEKVEIDSHDKEDLMSCTVEMKAENTDVETKWIAKPLSARRNMIDAGNVATDGISVVGEYATLTATTNNGYTFIGWYDPDDNEVCTDLVYTIVLSAEEITYTAKWYMLDIVKTIEDAGEIYGLTDQWYDLNSENNTARLRAETNDGYTFVGWYRGTDCLSTNLNECYVEMTRENMEESVVAKWYKVNLDAEVYGADEVLFEDIGSINTVVGTYVCNDEFTMIAETTGEGYTFMGWFDGENILSRDLTFEYNMPDDMPNDGTEYLYTAKWYKLDLQVSVKGAGTIDELKGQYVANETVRLNVVPSDVVTYKYIWLGWMVDDEIIEDSEESLSLTIEMPEVLKTYTAVFIERPVVFETNDDEAGNIIINSNNTVFLGDDFVVQAVTNDGYTFRGWFSNGVLVGENISDICSVSMTSESATYVAEWYKLNISVNDELYGSVSIESKPYTVGDDVTLVAETNDGYMFIGWFADDVIITDNDEISLQVNIEMPQYNNTEYVAKWIPCPITINVQPTASGTIEGLNPKTVSGDEITLTAIPEKGYIWGGWYNGNTLLAEGATEITFTISETQITYKAVFVLCEHPNKDTDNECYCSDCGINAHDPDKNCHCLSCGNDVHKPNERCVCLLCGARMHDVDQDCLCSICGEYVHALNEYCIHDDVVYFGSYPMGLVKDKTISDKLKDFEGTLPNVENDNGWTSYGYYANGRVRNYMWYKDVVMEFEKYRAVYFAEYRPNMTTKEPTKDNSYQDDNEYDSDIVYWFRFEPIKWRILEENNGELLLLSEDIIDCREYNFTTAKGTSENEEYFANNYMYSSIRNFLNNVFAETSFDEIQLAMIKEEVVDNSATTTSNSTNRYACDNTTDKVFLLSYADMLNADYGYKSSNESIDENKKKEISDYAKAQGAKGDWWTRSPYYNDGYNVLRVHEAGYVRSENATCTNVGVVPAIRIKIN